MGTRFLIDTNVIIDYLGGRLPASAEQWLQAETTARALAISVINRIELLSRVGTAFEMQQLALSIQASQVLPLDEPIVLETIRLRQLYKRKLPDAIIAATALVHNLPIVTRNLADFRAIPGLQLFDPHAPASLPIL